MTSLPHISLLTLVPLLGGALLLGLNPGHQRLARGLALGTSAVALLLGLGLAAGFNPAEGGLQFVERHEWIPSLGVEYVVGVDGLGLLMVLLAAMLTPLAIATSGRVTERVPLFLALMLFLEAGLFGAFTALNFFHWFLFWELSLVPAFFLIKLWGGADRTAAAVQFFVYTMVGSVTLLLAFLAMYLSVGTFDFMRLAELGQGGELASAFVVKLGWYSLTGDQLAMVIFLGAFLGFAVKVPLMPFHTWLPATYAEAPTPVTLLLTGAMSKMGVYGFLRILLPIFPDQMRAAQPVLLWLAVGTIVLGAAAAFAQRDLKRILAYSSINHLGYCLLGIFAVSGAVGDGPAVRSGQTAAIAGVILQMVNHGLTAAALFGFVSFIEARSGGVRGLNDFGGLRKVAPVLTGLMGISLFSSLGLPGLNGFVGEFLIFQGVFGLAPWAAAASALGLLITAVFILTVLQRVFSGPLNERWAGFRDLTPGEICILGPAVALMFVFGLHPQLLLGWVNATVTGFVNLLHP